MSASGVTSLPAASGLVQVCVGRQILALAKVDPGIEVAPPNNRMQRSGSA